MGSRIRIWEPGIVYSGSLRCNDRCFLLKPNHRRDNPLLHEFSPPDALLANNDAVPMPSTINVIGSAVARAYRQHPVDITWWESNINHIHFGLYPTADQLDNIAPFLQHANSLIARGVNQLLDHEGHVFCGPARFAACGDDFSAEHQLVYALTNPVKDGLISSTSGSPFFSTFRAQARGKSLRYWYIDWEAWWEVGGPRKKNNNPKKFLKWIELPIAGLPEHLGLPEHKVQARLRHGVRAVEDKHHRDLRAEGRTVAGIRALFALDPRDRPRNPKKTGSQPVCHAADPDIRREIAKRLRGVVSEHRRASWDFRQGLFEREFPDGTYRPPIATIYNSSHL